MNIIDAIKSGKAFKRTIWTRDYVRPPFMNLNLPAEDLLADDWEIEEPTVTTTASQVDSACRSAAASTQLGVGPIEFDIFVDALKKELGL